MKENKGLNRDREVAALTDIIFYVFKFNGRLQQSGDALVKDLGLNAARWQVLAALKDGPKTVADIARRFESSRQGVLKLANSMVRDGFLELTENPGYRRTKLVQMSDRGREAYAETIRRQTAHLHEVSSQYELDELLQALGVLERLEADWKARKPGP